MPDQALDEISADALGDVSLGMWIVPPRFWGSENAYVHVPARSCGDTLCRSAVWLDIHPTAKTRAATVEVMRKAYLQVA
jgi:hypothetical protein